MSWPSEFNREQVRAAIEEVIGAGLSIDDSLPDTLIANAGELGLTPVQLRLWIYDQPKIEWRATALRDWALRLGFIEVPAAPSEEHKCP